MAGAFAILTGMIDLHCHMLPAIDDGARDLDTALQMAELAAADGITTTVCTPHIHPGLFDNTHQEIKVAVQAFREALEEAGIPLSITYGADLHVGPGLVEGLADGSLPTLHESRYFLLEPPHHVSLPELPNLVHRALLTGYVPLITHPERLSYIATDYDKIVAAARAGAWIQLTGGALLGCFGPRVKRISERFLADGVVHVLASDGHNLKNRTPQLGEARRAAAAIVGEEESWRLVRERPAAVLENTEPDAIPSPPGLRSQALATKAADTASGGWLARMFNRR